jgi:hypothetical protein
MAILSSLMVRGRIAAVHTAEVLSIAPGLCAGIDRQ